MKRITFILVLLMAAGVAKGQEIVTEFWHENGKYLEIHNVVETTDNCLIVECPMFEAFSSNPEFHGLMFYKLSMDGVLMDSLLLELYNPWRTLFERHPEHPDSHVFAYMERPKTPFFSG